MTHWPTSQESFNVEARARELCADGFDSVDPHTYDWLLDTADEDEKMTLAEIAIRIASCSEKSHDRDALRVITQRLRDSYVAECAHFYREAAEAERDEYEQAKMEQTP